MRLTPPVTPVVFQEDLSRLRRKLEKQKKVEMYTDADEILQEEINQYKVRENQSDAAFIHTSFRSKDVGNTTKHLAPFTPACCQQRYKSFMSTQPVDMEDETSLLLA